MDFPFGHQSGGHHHRRDDDDEPRRYPGPPCSDPSNYPPPPQPHLHQPSYGGPHSYPGPAPPDSYPPPPPSYGGVGAGYDSYAPPPPPPQVGVGGVYHSSHDNYHPPPPQVPAAYGHHHEQDDGPHGFKPHMPSFIEHHFPGLSHSHNTGPESGPGPVTGPGFGPGSDLGELVNKPTYRIYCKAGGDRFAVAIRDGKVILTHTNPSDPTQHWYKDEKYSIRVKDEDGYPSFSLVNKATKQVMKHSVRGQPVQLFPYKAGVFDGSILWTESKDLGSGFRTIRMVNNIKLVLDAFNGDKDHGGVHDGTFIALYESWKGDNTNQQWKLVPY